MKLQIKARVRKYLANRKLEKSGYRSWRVYRHCRDNDIVKYADKVCDFYGEKYKYVHRIEYGQNHYAHQVVHDWGPGGIRFGYEDIRDWCEEKCRFKYRMDIHRAYKQTGIGINGDLHEDYWFNDIAGGDFVYFAFQHEQDYLMFILRWS